MLLNFADWLCCTSPPSDTTCVWQVSFANCSIVHTREAPKKKKWLKKKSCVRGNDTNGSLHILKRENNNQSISHDNHIHIRPLNPRISRYLSYDTLVSPLLQDFANTIPGHGGIMDRFDCQYLMATFTHVYIASFIRWEEEWRLRGRTFKNVNILYVVRRKLNRPLWPARRGSCDQRRQSKSSATFFF